MFGLRGLTRNVLLDVLEKNVGKKCVFDGETFDIYREYGTLPFIDKCDYGI